MPHILGLAGFMGSGKTFAGQYLAEHYGMAFINADTLVHELYNPGNAGYILIIKHYGKCFCVDQNLEDSPLDRNRMREFFLKNSQQLKKLEHLIQPLVSSKIIEQIKNYQLKKQPICIETIDFESEYFNLGTFQPDSMVWIQVRKDVLWERVKERPGMTKELFESFLQHQHKPQRIDYIIENNNNLDVFQQKLSLLYPHIL